MHNFLNLLVESQFKSFLKLIILFSITHNLLHSTLQSLILSLVAQKQHAPVIAYCPQVGLRAYCTTPSLPPCSATPPPWSCVKDLMWQWKSDCYCQCRQCAFGNFLTALFAVHNNKNSMSLHEHKREKLSVTVNVGDLRRFFWRRCWWCTTTITSCLCMNMLFGADLNEIHVLLF